MKQSIIYALLFTTLVSCSRQDDDVSGSATLNGKVFLVNPYDSFPPQPVANQVVLLQKESDASSTSFMFSTTTDSSGKFGFQFLHENRPYKLYAEARRNTRWDSDILFTATGKTPDQTTVLNLTPDLTTQNGLFFICLDSVKTDVPGIIPGDSIYIYPSSVLAIEDSTRIVGAGARLVIANMNGKALKMNLPSDRPLYVNAARTYGGKRYTSRYKKVNARQAGVDTVYLYFNN